MQPMSCSGASPYCRGEVWKSSHLSEIRVGVPCLVLSGSPLPEGRVDLNAVASEYIHSGFAVIGRIRMEEEHTNGIAKRSHLNQEMVRIP